MGRGMAARGVAGLVVCLGAGGAMAQDNPLCILSLTACDYEREDAGACPTGTAAVATLWAEGEHWYLDTTGITADPADGPSVAEDRLMLVNAGTTGDATQVFYIVDHAGLDGVFLLAGDGAARISVQGDAGPDRTPFQTLFTGLCERVQP